MEKSGTRYFEYFDPETGIRYPFRCTYEDYDTTLADIKSKATESKRTPSDSKYKTRKFPGKFKDGEKQVEAAPDAVPVGDMQP
jgi:hypothetical protein